MCCTQLGSLLICALAGFDLWKDCGARCLGASLCWHNASSRGYAVGDKRLSVVLTTRGERRERNLKHQRQRTLRGSKLWVSCTRESAELGMFISFGFLTSYLTPQLMEEVGP